MSLTFVELNLVHIVRMMTNSLGDPNIYSSINNWCKVAKVEFVQ